MKYDVIIQARMNSTRLPGKIFKLINGSKALGLVIRRVLQSKKVNRVIVATTTNDSDNPVCKYLKDINIPFFRGSEDNVLERYYLTALNFESDAIIRITSDCPLIDPSLIDEFIEEFERLISLKSVDYLSNKIDPTYPIGQDIEIFTFETLKKSYQNADKKYQFEHVTPYIYENQNKFKVYNMAFSQDLSNVRMTLDTKDDLMFIRALYRHFNRIDFGLLEILDYLNKNPEIRELNSHVRQKKYYE